MGARDKLIKEFQKFRRRDFFCRLLKIIFLATLSILTPFLIYDTIIKQDIMTVIVLLIAELLFVILAIMLFRDALEFYKIKGNSLFQCIDNPELLTEIIVTPHKIVFEIKGMIDETIHIKESKYRSLLITNIKEVFGEDKIVKNY